MDEEQRLRNFFREPERLAILNRRFRQIINDQQGGAITRSQAKENPPNEIVGPLLPTKRKRKLESQEIVSEIKKLKPSAAEEPESQVPPSPVATSSKKFIETTLPMESDDDLMDYERTDGSENELFKTSTTVYEDDLLEINVVKEMFRRQKIFSIEDHSYVMRVKLKQKDSQYPRLDSLYEVLEKAFTYMINNLKLFITPDPSVDNLIFLTIYQDGMTNAINSGSFRLQSVETKNLVEDVLNIFENYVNSDSTLDVLDNSFKCYFRVLSVAHVEYPKNRRKAVPKPERVPSRLGCRLGRRFIITKNSGLYDIPGNN